MHAEANTLTQQTTHRKRILAERPLYPEYIHPNYPVESLNQDSMRQPQYLADKQAGTQETETHAKKLEHRGYSLYPQTSYYTDKDIAFIFEDGYQAAPDYNNLVHKCFLPSEGVILC